MINRDEFILLLKSYYKNYNNSKEIQEILKMNFGNQVMKKIKSFYIDNGFQNSLKSDKLNKLYNQLNKERKG